MGPGGGPSSTHAAPERGPVYPSGGHRSPPGGRPPLQHQFRLAVGAGWASPPLYVYCLLAARFEVAPGELLGTEGVERTVSDAELTLVRWVRRLGLAPEDAIALLATGSPRASEH